MLTARAARCIARVGASGAVEQGVPGAWDGAPAQPAAAGGQPRDGQRGRHVDVCARGATHSSKRFQLWDVQARRACSRRLGAGKCGLQGAPGHKSRGALALPALFNGAPLCRLVRPTVVAGGAAWVDGGRGGQGSLQLNGPALHVAGREWVRILRVFVPPSFKEWQGDSCSGRRAAQPVRHALIAGLRRRLTPPGGAGIPCPG